MPCHIGKRKTILSSIKESFDYGKNPDKTRNSEFISSYKCSPITAEYEFLLSKKQYELITGKTQSREHNIYFIRYSSPLSPERLRRKKQINWAMNWQ